MIYNAYVCDTRRYQETCFFGCFRSPEAVCLHRLLRPQDAEEALLRRGDRITSWDRWDRWVCGSKGPNGNGF